MHALTEHSNEVNQENDCVIKHCCSDVNGNAPARSRSGAVFLSSGSLAFKSTNMLDLLGIFQGTLLWKMLAPIYEYIK